MDNCDATLSACNKLKFSGIIFNDGDDFSQSKITWNNAVEAFIAPDIIDGDIEKESANGVYNGANRYGRRQMLITGSVIAESREELNEIKRDMDAKISNISFSVCDSGFKDIRFVKDGLIMTNRAKLVDGINWVYRNDTSLVFSFTISLENYFFYGCEKKCINIQSSCATGNLEFDCTNTADDITCVFDTKVSEKNIIFPYTFGKTSKSVIEVENTGTYKSHMKIRINGSCKNPVIGNKTTGQEARLEIELAKNEILEIDTEKYQINKIGNCESANVVNLLSGELPFLVQGVNELYLYDECCGEFTADILYTPSFI